MTYTCPISNFSQSAARSCAIRIGRVFFLSSCKINAGVKVIVPAAYECEDGLNRNRRFHQWKYDLIKGMELAGTVDTRRLDEGQRQGAFHVLFHVEKM